MGVKTGVKGERTVMVLCNSGILFAVKITTPGSEGKVMESVSLHCDS